MTELEIADKVVEMVVNGHSLVQLANELANWRDTEIAKFKSEVVSQ